jgi:hypothetical protein
MRIGVFGLKNAERHLRDRKLFRGQVVDFNRLQFVCQKRSTTHILYSYNSPDVAFNTTCSLRRGTLNGSEEPPPYIWWGPSYIRDSRS